MPDPPAYLVTGPDEFLVRREAERVLGTLGTGEDEVELTDVRADELGESGLPDLRTGSLFGTARVVRVRQAHMLSSDHAAALLAYLEGHSHEATVVLEASGTGRIRKLAKRIQDAGGRIDVDLPREWEERKWLGLVAEELARHRRKADEGGLRALLDHAGLDAGQIAEKVAQVAAAAGAERVTADDVHAVVVGHGDRGAFAVADAMCERDPARAVTLLRGVLDGGQDPVMVLGALTYRLRTIVAVAGDVGGKIGTSISKGQAKRLAGIRANFGPGELTRAYRTLAEADLAIKSADLPPEQVIEHAVVEIATAASERSPATGGRPWGTADPARGHAGASGRG